MSVVGTSQFRHGPQRTTIEQFSGKGSKLQDSNGNYCQYLVDETPDIMKAKSTIEQLRKAVSDCKLPDSRDEYLLKWLSVNGFDAIRAEKMLRQSLEWRRLNGVDDIWERYTPPEVLMKYYPFGQVGVDKYGSPVFVHALGRADIAGISMSSTKKEQSNFTLFMLESYIRATKLESERTGRPITRSTYIFDYECISFRHMTSRYTIDNGVEGARLMFTHYPDSSRRLFIINAPSYFSIVYAMIKSFLYECDVAKIKIFDNNRKEWTAALLEEIDADQLPACYGGTMTDPDGDPKCPSKFRMGGKIPPSYYLSNNAPIAKDYMETMNVMAGGKKKLKLKIDIPKSSIRWEFMTEGGDVKFRIYNKDSKGSDDLIPQCRVDSHLIMEEGQMTCDQPGTYVVEFDNSFSYLRAKKIRYHVVVDPPSS